MTRVMSTAKSRGGGKLPMAIIPRAEFGAGEVGKTAGLHQRRRSMENVHFNMKGLLRLYVIM